MIPPMRRSEVTKEAPSAADEQLALPAEKRSASMGDWYDRIITTITKIDPEAEFEYLTMELKLSTPGSQADAGVLADALEVAQDNARRAHALYVHANIANEGAKIDAKVLESAVRELARDQLVDERASEPAELDAKGKPKGPKAPTIDDIEARMHSKHADELRDLAQQKAENEGTVEHLKRLADLWRDRIRTLETMFAKSRI